MKWLRRGVYALAILVVSNLVAEANLEVARMLPRGVGGQEVLLWPLFLLAWCC